MCVLVCPSAAWFGSRVVAGNVSQKAKSCAGLWLGESDSECRFILEVAIDQRAHNVVSAGLKR